MNASRRPPSPLDKRAVAEGAGRALRETAPPDDSFVEGVEAQRNLDRMCPETERGCDLGPYVPPGSDGAASLGGRQRTIRFPDFWHDWFSAQTAERLSVIDELVDERQEREVLRRFFRRLKHGVVIAVVAGAACAHWFSDQIAWLVERLPVLREFWNLITRSGKT